MRGGDAPSGTWPGEGGRSPPKRNTDPAGAMQRAELTASMWAMSAVRRMLANWAKALVDWSRTLRRSASRFVALCCATKPTLEKATESA